MTAASDLVDHFKFDVDFYPEYTRHVFHISDHARGWRKLRVEKKWYRQVRLGQGGFGTVWLEKEHDGEVRAVKEIPKKSSLQSQIDYKKELLAMSVLSKAKLMWQYPEAFVQFYGWFENVDTIFLAMEYFENGDLSQHLTTKVSEDEARIITKQLLEGLSIMHKGGFTHRDLKPQIRQNIFVVSRSPTWWVKIGDFGISKRIESVNTALRTVAGTQHFQAPEILGFVDEEEETSEYTNAVDIWSLGCVTYEVLTRKVPFPDLRALRLYSVGREQFPTDTSTADSVSVKGIEFIKSLMAPDPSKRLTAETALAASWLVGVDELLNTLYKAPTGITEDRPDAVSSSSFGEPTSEPAQEPTITAPQKHKPHPARNEPNWEIFSERLIQKIAETSSRRPVVSPASVTALARHAVGIDFGTTSSCVAVYRDDRIEVIPDEQGDPTTPSVVAFKESERLIGVSAKNQIVTNHSNTISSVKRLLGLDFTDPLFSTATRYSPFTVINKDNKPLILGRFKGESKTLAPEEVTSMVLSKLRKTAESYLSGTVKDAVITVPTSYTGSQRQSIRDASLVAGLNVLRIINEPTAAAAAWGISNKRKVEDDFIVLIFDLGGGYCSASLVGITDGDLLEVLSTAGHAALGGDDFDKRLVEHFVNGFKRRHKKDITSDARALCRLRIACERIKCDLSTSTQASIQLDSFYEGLHFRISITRAQFEELCQDLFLSIIHPVRRVLDNAKVRMTSVDEVVLVGGSTRIPKIQSLISDYFNGKKLNRSMNPDQSTAHGAAIMASILTGDTTCSSTEKFLLVDVAPFSVGIAIGDGPVHVVIERLTNIPNFKSEDFSTTFDNQSEMVFQVFELGDINTHDNRLLGELTLTGIRPAPCGVPKIEVRVGIDSQPCLDVSAWEKGTNNRRKKYISDYKHLVRSQTEIDDMKNEARKYDAEDEIRAARIFARNDLESYVYSLENLCEDPELKQKLGAENLEDLKAEVKRTISWLDDTQDTTERECDNQLKYLKKLFILIMRRI